MYTIGKKSSQAINALRVIFTVMIVYIHSRVGAEDILSAESVLYGTEYAISEIISRIAVPGFFLISAILLYRKPFSWKDNMKNKVTGILIPYLVMNTLWILFFLIAKKIGFLSPFFNTHSSDVYNWNLADWLNAYLGFDKLPVLAQTWFLRDLFVMNLLAPVLKWVIDRIPKIWLIAATLLWFSGLESPLFFLNIRTVYFFSLGYYFVKYNYQLSDIKKLPLKLIFPIYLAMAGAVLVLRLYAPKNIVVNITAGSLHNIAILFGLALAVHAALSFDKIQKNRIYKLILKYNFSIYLFHELNLTIARKFIWKVAGHTPAVQGAAYFILPVILIGLCILLSMFLNRFLPRVFGVITGNRTTIREKAGV